jgi:hypothetical protein
MVVFAVVPAALFATAVASGLWGMTRTRDNFSQFVEHEQRLAQDLNEMYAQGLQTGQALRNIVLDPSNSKAYTNLQDAETAFAAVNTSAQRIAADSPQAGKVAALQALRATHKQAQDKVLALVKTEPAAAAKLLVSEETPAWRSLRAELLDQVKVARAASDQVMVQTQADARLALGVALLLAATATAASLLFTRLQHRALTQELGGDPAEACRAVRQLALGDL